MTGRFPDAPAWANIVDPWTGVGTPDESRTVRRVTQVGSATVEVSALQTGTGRLEGLYVELVGGNADLTPADLTRLASELLTVVAATPAGWHVDGLTTVLA